jgi:hypothetical protein
MAFSKTDALFQLIVQVKRGSVLSSTDRRFPSPFFVLA